MGEIKNIYASSTAQKKTKEKTPESNGTEEGADINRGGDNQKNRELAVGASWRSRSMSEPNTRHDQSARKDWAGWSALWRWTAKRQESTRLTTVWAYFQNSGVVARFAAKRKMKNLPVSRFVPEELLGGAASKEEKNHKMPARPGIIWLFGVCAGEETRSRRRSKKPRRTAICPTGDQRCTGDRQIQEKKEPGIVVPEKEIGGAICGKVSGMKIP